MSSDKKDEEMICALTPDEHDALQAGLGALPDTMPPREVWHRIREQAEAEGLIGTPRSRRPSTWYTGGGLAAAAVLVAFLVPMLINNPGTVDQIPETYTTPKPGAETGNTTHLAVLQALQVESRQLENDLRSLPNEPRVKRAGTQATILELEDRIGAIDYQLSDPSLQLTDEETQLFWRERVRLMKSLVALRSAQAQRTAF